MRRTVDVALVDDERLLSDEELRALVPARVALDEDPAVGQKPAGHRLLVERELPHPREDEQLVAAGEVRRDEQLGAVW